MNPSRIIAVVGFPRCGTTLTMRLLHTLGVPVEAESTLSFETERTQVHTFDPKWLRLACPGKAVKILEPQRLNLPCDLAYDFIWCSRNPAEQAKSQCKILQLWVGLNPSRADVTRMALGIMKDTPIVQSKLKGFPDHRWLEMKFEETLAGPFRAGLKLARFLGLEEDLRLWEAAEKVKKRSPKCLDGMLEATLLGEES